MQLHVETLRKATSKGTLSAETQMSDALVSAVIMNGVMSAPRHVPTQMRRISTESDNARSATKEETQTVSTHEIVVSVAEQKNASQILVPLTLTHEFENVLLVKFMFCYKQLSECA